MLGYTVCITCEPTALLPNAAQQIVGRERREHVSQLDSSGDGLNEIAPPGEALAFGTMSHRAQIKELALAVNDALTVYIAVHDAIFREAATFKSFLKNILGRGVPMSTLIEESEELLPLWDGIRQKIVDFRQANYSSLSEEERRYFDILSRYVEAVCETVRALVDRQQLLNQGSMGGPRNPMTWDALQQKQRIYEQSVQRYVEIGNELTAAGPIIFR